MTKGKGIGQALYTEFRKPDFTNQHLFFPERYDVDAKVFVGATLMTRQVSKNKPKAGWRFRFESSVKGTRTLNPSDGTLKADLPLDAAFDTAIAIFEDYQLHFDSVLTGGSWKFYRVPLVIEYTAKDLADLAKRKTPEALNLRLNKARTEAGFPEDLWSNTDY
jgi:hypothetical protein